MRGRDYFNKYETIILFFIRIVSLLSISKRKKLLEKYRETNGKIGLGIRYILLRSITKSCGNNVYIGPGVYIFNAENLIIGSNVSIHPMSYVECGYEPGAIEIGNDVSIAHGTTIMATTHPYQISYGEIIKDHPVITGRVVIEDNVWIGAKATILSSVTIATGSVIGANSVVTKSTEKDQVYVGAPAKRIKSRVE